MRLRQQFLIVAAVVVATTAVAVNVFAYAQVQERRAALHETTMTFAPVPIPTTQQADPLPDRPLLESDSGDLDHDLRLGSVDHLGAPQAVGNHGAVVSAVATRLRFVEGLDGPPGALIRTIARTNPHSESKSNGPPSHAQADDRGHGKPAEPPGRSRDH